VGISCLRLHLRALSAVAVLLVRAHKRMDADTKRQRKREAICSREFRVAI
jgi:hypothetical protein